MYPERDSESTFWRKIPSREESAPYYQAFLDKAKRKNPSFEFINELIHLYVRKHEDEETFNSEYLNEENLNNFDNKYGLSTENANFAEKNTMNENEIMSLNDLPFKHDVENQGGKIYSVGGAVRDKFLGKDSKDLDIIVTGIPFDKLEKIVSRYGVVNSVGKSFGVLKFKPQGATEDIDIVIPRTDKPTGGGGYQDFDITTDHSLPIEKDLERRDFTINAMAKDNEGNLIDPYGGQEDLKNKIIRAVNPEAFSDDPLRMLRAVQFASRFGFTIEPHTMKMIQDSAASIKRISAERYLIEFDKIIKKGNIIMGVELLMKTGLFSQIFNAQPKNVSPLFAKVKTMAEFLYLLMTGSVQNPAEFYLEHFASDEDAKRSKNYKEIRALDTGFESGEATNLIEARSIAHNMYLIFPTVLESQILPNIIGVAAQELLQGKYPKTVNELAVNGNELAEQGLKGKAIGDMQKTLLLKIYADKLKNDKTELLNFINKNNTGMLKEEKKTERIEYGCFMLFLDVPVWSKITSVIDKNDIYDKEGYGIENEPHLTLLYGFHDEVTPEEVFDLYKSKFELKPLDVKIKGISIFENPEFDVVKFDVNPEGLTEINTVMKELPNTSVFPDYHPHITIAYVKKGEGHKYIRPFEKERKLKGNELVYTWKGHRGNDGEKLMLEGGINELAYPEMNSAQSNWNVNGQQVGLPFFVEKYDLWNQGAYTDPSDFTVVQFLHSNFKELAGDEKLKKELLWALTDRNILDESAINEASIDTFSYEAIVTPEYIRQVEMSDNFEMFLDYYRYEFDLVGTDSEEIEDTDEFKNWFKYELMNRYDDAVDRISAKIKPDGTIDIWRRITVNDEENRWITHLAEAGKHLGIYWSWDERAAEAHWGNSAHSNNVLIKSSIKEEYVDWKNTLFANMDISLGEDEKEITLLRNTSLKIQELYIDDQDVMASGLASGLKDKTFYA
jgi:tRNA nucleotidyltransferase/poly(A) polymerase